MFFKRYYVCSAFGIPLYVDISFAVIALLMLSGGLLAAVVGPLILALSLVAHELGHSLTARRFGFPTVDITLSVLGGCASLSDIPRDPTQELKVALAGPAVSFALASAGIFGTAFFFKVPVLGFAFGGLAAMNLMLCFFNLMPGFPMDGGRMLRACLMMFGRKRRIDATWTAVVVGRYFALVLAGLALVSVASGHVGGLTSILVAYFVWKAGEMEYRATRARP